MQNSLDEASENKNPLRYLLWLPIMLVLDAILLYAFLRLDALLCTPKNGEIGFPMPIVFMIAANVLGAINIIVLIVIIVLMIRCYMKNKKVSD